MSSPKATKVHRCYWMKTYCNHAESHRHGNVEADGTFSFSAGEVDIVELHIKALTEAGLKAKDIAVIAPYNLQVSHSDLTVYGSRIARISALKSRSSVLATSNRRRFQLVITFSVDLNTNQLSVWIM